MLLPASAWEYTKHSNYSANLMAVRAKQMLVLLYSKTSKELKELIKDIRPVHRAYFKDLTPIGSEYFAGHYRGENYPALVDYEVWINRYKGTQAALVPRTMVLFATELDGIIDNLFACINSSDKVIIPEVKLFRLAEVVAYIFVKGLSIHPFANGNGHSGRFITVMICGACGYWKIRFPPHPRPPSPLDDFIDDYRQGNKQPLIRYFLQRL